MTSDLLTQCLENEGPPTIHTYPELREELHGWRAGGSGMWTKGVCGCVWEQLEWTVIIFSRKIVVLLPHETRINTAMESKGQLAATS